MFVSTLDRITEKKHSLKLEDAVICCYHYQYCLFKPGTFSLLRNYKAILISLLYIESIFYYGDRHDFKGKQLLYSHLPNYLAHLKKQNKNILPPSLLT